MLARRLAMLVVFLHSPRLVAQDTAVLTALKEQAFAHSTNGGKRVLSGRLIWVAFYGLNGLCEGG